MPAALPAKPHPLIGESLLTLALAAREFPSRNGRHVNPATVWRWTEQGVRTKTGRIRLERIRAGSLFYTSREAIARFLEALNEPAEATEEAAPRTPGQRSRAAQRAVAELEKLGV